MASASTRRAPAVENGNDSIVDTLQKPGEAETNDAEADTLTEQVSKLTLLPEDDDDTPLIICDAGYGLPSEARPRKEKILAIIKQLYNFLDWQMKSCTAQDKKVARVQVVGSTEVSTCLQDRLQQLWDGPLPSHVRFLSQDLEDCISSNDSKVVYLSPDAADTLDPSKRPPSTVMVGLLIDRRIQLNRSKNRASSLNMASVRWPLEEFSNIDSQEPLNVDTVMEGMQQWHWNCDKAEGKECFLQAATQAIERHARRHPNRPLHKTK